MKLAFGVLGLTLVMAASASAQNDSPAAKPAFDRHDCYSKPDPCQMQTFYLANTSQFDEANQILIALRNMLDPAIKVYMVSGQNAIVMYAPADELRQAQKLINDLDRPKKIYRLTYTVSESDAGKRVGTQHFAMIVTSGQRTVLKEGSRVPVLTGSYSNGGADSKVGAGVQTQYTYLDIGMNFSATLNETGQGAVLQSKVEQSSIADQKSSFVETDPIVRQTVLEGTSFLSPGKPVMLGSLDIPGTTRHVDIDVMMELVQ